MTNWPVSLLLILTMAWYLCAPSSWTWVFDIICLLFWVVRHSSIPLKKSVKNNCLSVRLLFASVNDSLLGGPVAYLVELRNWHNVWKSHQLQFILQPIEQNRQQIAALFHWQAFQCGWSRYFEHHTTEILWRCFLPWPPMMVFVFFQIPPDYVHNPFGLVTSSQTKQKSFNTFL